MSAHKHISVTPPSKTPPASSKVVSPQISALDSVAPRRAFTFFAIAFVVAGTLPVGVGLGVAFRAKSAVPAKSDRSIQDETSANNEIDSVSWAWRNQQHADDLFRAGDFELAIQLYQSKECADSLQPAAELSLKIAMCREALGQWDEALAILGPFTNHSNSELRAAALLAHSRIWIRRHDLDKARATLGQLLRQTDEPGRSCPTEIADEAGFLLAIACVLDESSLKESSDLARPISPMHSSVWKSFDIWLLDRPTVARSKLLLDAAESNVTTPDISMLGTEAQELVPQLLAVTSVEERRRIGEELSQQLLTRHPAHRLKGLLHLALGEVAYQRGDLAEAAARYGEAARRSPTALSAIATYNQGVVQFLLHEYRHTSLVLGRFLDGAPGHELCSRALILRGRALLEFGEGKLAAFDLKRAADLPGRDDERAWATVYLGMANLQARKPKLAAQEMFQRRDRLQTGIARAEMAFVVSLARLESLESSESLDREALFMLRALTMVDPEAEWLGACGRLMIGRAYQHLGLIEQAADIYEQALRQEVQEPFASEMKLALAEHRLAFGDPSQGLTLLAELRAAQQAPWSVAASVRVAEWELSHGRERECLAICQDLLLQDIDHAPILRLMGLAYERAGDHAKAAECYAGVAR